MLRVARGRVFVCCSRRDQRWLRRMKTMLAPMIRQGLLELLDESRIGAGQHVIAALGELIASADVLVMLVSPDFLDEVLLSPQGQPLLEHARTRGVLIFWVLIRACLYDRLEFAAFKPAHDVSRPLEALRAHEANAELVAICRQITEAALKVSASSEHESAPNLPPRNPWFTGRGRLLDELERAFRRDYAGATCQPLALYGLGGVGKTQIALEFAWRNRSRYQRIFWLQAGKMTELRTGMLSIASLLGLSPPEGGGEEALLEEVRRWFQTHEQWLLVLDNADEPEAIRSQVPLRPRGHILLTSRAQVFQRLGVTRPIEVPGMPPREALEFLIKRTGRKAVRREQHAAASELAGALGYLPLALEQAAAYLVERQQRFDLYLAAFRQQRLEVLEKAAPVAGEYPESVLTTWSMNFEQVEGESPAAADLLRTSAFLCPDDIPQEIMEEGALELGPNLSAAAHRAVDDPLWLDGVLSLLTRFSLIRVDIEARTYHIHRLVQEVVRSRMDETTRRLWAERVTRAVGRVFPSGEYSTWTRCERVLPHAREAAALVRKMGLESWSAGRLLNQVGYYLRQTGRYRDAEEMYREAVRTLDRLPGGGGDDLAAALNNLAALQRDLQNFGEAEALYERALALREHASGQDLSNVANVAVCLTGLALTYKARQRFDDAEALLKRALTLCDEAFGREHPSRARCFNNLAALYEDLKRFDEAEQLYRQALDLRQRLLEPTHPDIAISLNNLGGLYFSRGRFLEAEPLCKQTLAIWEQSLEPEHPRRVLALQNYSKLLLELGRVHEAQECEALALEIQRLRMRRGERM